MLIDTELDDTATLCGTSLEFVSQPTLDDTATLHFASHDANPKTGQTGQTHRFAQGIIRFYRARSILRNDPGLAGCRRAWGYLKRLGPSDLPPESRHLFLELVYCLGRQTTAEAFESPEFRELVLSVAEAIDTFVDQISEEVDS